MEIDSPALPTPSKTMEIDSPVLSSPSKTMVIDPSTPSGLKLENLKLERNDIYAPIPQFVGGSGIQCGILNLDSILHRDFSETVLFALYQYAQLAQRIFYMSNPTRSRSQEVLLPNTFVEFKLKIQNEPAKYFGKLKELIGYGNPGFKHNPFQQVRYGLIVIYDTAYNVVVAGQLLVLKVTATGIVNEIWGVVVDPLYMGSGAGAFMILLTLHESSNLIKYFYNAEAPLTNMYHELEVAKDSFPFIEFIDRFTFYARNGFSKASGMAKAVSRKIFANVAFDMNEFLFTSKYSRAYEGPHKEVIFTKEIIYNMSLTEWKAAFSTIIPEPDPNQICFKTVSMDNYNFDSIYRDVVMLNGKVQRTKLDTRLPTEQYGWISHSGYVEKIIDGNPNFISTFRVPDNCEIIIMNSPGYATFMNTLDSNWNANAKYFRNVPIDFLQKLFPPFKSETRGGVNIIPADSYHAFTHATSGGVLFKIQKPDEVNYMQIHCYKAGDLCPNMQLECILGNTDDHAAALFGQFDISHEPDYKKLRLTNDFERLDPMGGLLFNDTREYRHSVSRNKWPDKSYRVFPDANWLRKKGFSAKAPKIFMSDLETILGRAFPSKTRHCFFSCGNVENTLDDHIKTAWSQRKNHTFDVDVKDYDKRISRLGEAIYDIYNVDIRRFGFSPASVRPSVKPLSVAVAAAPVLAPAPGAFGLIASKRSQASKGIRSKRSQASKGIRSRMSMKTRKVSKRSKVSSTKMK